MKAVIQRVNNATVTINNEIHSSIEKGMLVLFCVEKGDTDDKLDWMAKKYCHYECLKTSLRR